jgi:protein-tyrosine-phosphatase
MAKGLLKKLISERKDLASEKIKVTSAGTSTFSPRGTTKETIEVMSREGIDISKHLPQSLTDEMIEEADLILVMESFHKDAIIKRTPQAKDKVHLITEFCRPEGEERLVNPDVPDPIGRPIEVYEESFKIIKEAIERIVKKLWPEEKAGKK